MKRILVIGAGGHAHSVCDILLQDKENLIVGLVDSPETKGFWGLKVLGGDELLPRFISSGMAEYVFVGIGDNSLRKKLTEKAASFGYQLVNAISPYAYISPYAHLGQGVAVMPGAIIGPQTRIGPGCIINTNASVDHDNQIHEYCHIAPGSTLCGYVTVGERVFVGAGARLIDRIRIGDESVIGAGAAVINDLPDRCVAVGVPAKVIKTLWQNQ